MFYVYLLRSQSIPSQTYIGSTGDLKERLAAHNSGKSTHTNNFKPWQLIAYVAFRERAAAEQFERCLKTGSGRAFIKRHFLVLAMANGTSAAN